jgi:uncharacterized membrane protein YfcA
MENIFIYILVGFLAQMIDGTLGMAYGVSSTTFLLSAGVSPKIAGASVHIAEVFTTFVSGISHLGFKNINKALLTKLVIPGVLGGITGAYILINAPSEVIKPFVDIYLVIMGIIILVKAFKSIVQKELEGKKIWGLGLIGGFFDAIGGGGWGPIVTSTLVANGYNPRYAIGTVNLAEFFVTVSQAATFVTFLGFSQYWRVIVGLAAGGVIAAPMASLLCKKLPTKVLMILVGGIVVFLNLRNLILLLI